MTFKHACYLVTIQHRILNLVRPSCQIFERLHQTSTDNFNLFSDSNLNIIIKGERDTHNVTVENITFMRT